MIHICFQIVTVARATRYYYRPCFSTTPDGGARVAWALEDVDCAVCRESKYFKDLEVQYELGDFEGKQDFANRLYDQLHDNQIKVHTEEEREALGQYCPRPARADHIKYGTVVP